MWTDPIVEEVRRTRQEYAKQFDYDLHAMVADLRTRKQEHLDRSISFPSKPPGKGKRTQAS